jgi:hypothetical protein
MTSDNWCAVADYSKRDIEVWTKIGAKFLPIRWIANKG